MSDSDRLLEIFSPTELQDLSSSPLVLIGDQMPELVVLQLCESRGIRHVVQRSNLRADLETRVSKFMLDHPHEFIRYPISTILGSDSPSDEAEAEALAVNVKIESPDQKVPVIELLTEFGRRHRNPNSLIYDFSIVADELISNALYNAPYVDELNSKSGPARSPKNIVIDPKKQPEVFAGSDSTRIVLGVRDFYGRLNSERLVQRIRDCYEKNLRDQISYLEGGAGIGSFMIFNSCTSMYIAVEKGRSTTVCCSFPIGMSAGKRSSIPKNIHILSF